MNKPKVGDQITIYIENFPYVTEIDANGVQRFIKNEVLDYMFYNDINGNKIDDMDCKTPRMLSMNAISIAYQHGKFSKRDYAEFIMALGYSVCGFAEYEEFQDWTINNPLWE